VFFLFKKFIKLHIFKNQYIITSFVFLITIDLEFSWALHLYMYRNCQHLKLKPQRINEWIGYGPKPLMIEW